MLRGVDGNGSGLHSKRDVGVRDEIHDVVPVVLHAGEPEKQSQAHQLQPGVFGVGDGLPIGAVDPTQEAFPAILPQVIVF